MFAFHVGADIIKFVQVQPANLLFCPLQGCGGKSQWTTQWHLESSGRQVSEPVNDKVDGGGNTCPLWVVPFPRL